MNWNRPKIQLTENAATRFEPVVQKNVPDYGLRIFVSGGGCSGMQYGMALDAEPGENDHVLTMTGSDFCGSDQHDVSLGICRRLRR